MHITKNIIGLITLAAVWITALVSCLSQKKHYEGIQAWTPTSAIILENTSEDVTVRKDSPYSGTKISTTRMGSVIFTYVVGGKEYKGTKASPNNDHLPKDFDIENPIAYYNPIKPDIAVLVKEEYNGGKMLYVVLVIPLLLFALLIIRRDLFNWT